MYAAAPGALTAALEPEEGGGRGQEAAAQDFARTAACPKGCVCLRTHPDLTELELPSTMQTQFPDPADLMHFEVTITPDEGKHVAC